MYLVLGKWCGFFVHKWRSLNSQKNVLWIFCPQMTLTQFPICGFFVHNFQIGVKAISQIFTSQNWIASTSVKPLYNIRFMVVRMACESLLIFKILKCWKLWKYKNHQFGTCCFDNLWKCGHVITYMSQMVFSFVNRKLEIIFKVISDVEKYFKDEIVVKITFWNFYQLLGLKNGKSDQNVKNSRRLSWCVCIKSKHVYYFISVYSVSFTLVWFIFWFTRRILFTSNLKNWNQN